MGLQGCDILSYSGDSVPTNPLPRPHLVTHQRHCTIWASVWAARPRAGVIFLQANLWVVLSWAERKADSRRLSRSLFQAPVFKGKWPTWVGGQDISKRPRGGRSLRSGEPRMEALPHNSCAAQAASTFGWKDFFGGGGMLTPLSFFHMQYINGTGEKKITELKTQASCSSGALGHVWLLALKKIVFLFKSTSGLRLDERC